MEPVLHYISIEGKACGPFSYRKLAVLRQFGILDENTLVYSEETQNWLPIGDLEIVWGAINFIQTPFDATGRSEEDEIRFSRLQKELDELDSEVLRMQVEASRRTHIESEWGLVGKETTFSTLLEMLMDRLPNDWDAYESKLDLLADNMSALDMRMHRIEARLKP